MKILTVENKKAPKKIWRPYFYLADLIFDPTLACWNFRFGVTSLLVLSILYRQVLLLSRAMLTLPFLEVAYVDPFARDWLGLATTDPNTFISYIYFQQMSIYFANLLVVPKCIWKEPTTPSTYNACCLYC